MGEFLKANLTRYSLPLVPHSTSTSATNALALLASCEPLVQGFLIAGVVFGAQTLKV